MSFEQVPPTEEKPCVIYMDDDANNRRSFQAAFRKDMIVLPAASLQEALGLMQQRQVHVLIADQRMPGISGSEALGFIRARHPRVRRMLVTAFADLQAVVDALNFGGACYYIQKPWEEAHVRSAVMRAYAEFRAEEERITFTDRLLQANQQLEFALRQRLLS